MDSKIRIFDDGFIAWVRPDLIKIAKGGSSVLAMPLENTKGGEGSGHHGHLGRLGQEGGSLPAGAKRDARGKLVDKVSQLERGHTYVDRLAYFITPGGKLADVYGSGYATHIDALKDPAIREAMGMEGVPESDKDVIRAIERGAIQVSIASKTFFITTGGEMNTRLLERIQKLFDTEKLPASEYRKPVTLHAYPQNVALDATVEEILSSKYLIVNSRGGYLKGKKTYEKDLHSFTRNVRHAISAFWRGDIVFNEFTDILSDQLEMELWNAWDEGMRECGLGIEDLTPIEAEYLQAVVEEQKEYVHGFGVDIAIGNRASGGALAPLLRRGDLWIARYNGTKALAQTMVCMDQRLEWQYGETEHCATCLRLNGIVKRAAVWQAADLRPGNAPNDKLECGGWACQCKLIPTNKPATPGPLPMVP